MLAHQWVQNEPFIVQVNGGIIVFNHGYPDYARLTRHDITAKVKHLLKHAGTNSSSIACAYHILAAATEKRAMH